MCDVVHVFAVLLCCFTFAVKTDIDMQTATGCVLYTDWLKLCNFSLISRPDSHTYTFLEELRGSGIV